ncbi:M35 family metallo-endopeptidase [Treponema pedis]|uniref:M35 family metallo-endopeptidase n=1 Tax=Treponema pedis TaxID=409322 RepID=UPI00198243A4|nr:M35 family metallo-endopeptidase [Treponema pedis]
MKYIDPDGRATHTLTDAQWAIVEDAKNRTVSNLDKIIETLNNCGNDKSKLDPKILESAQTYLHSEFGTLPLDLPLLADMLNELKEHINSLTRDDFRYDDATSSYAYTFMFTDDVWLGDLFFAAPDTGAFDTKEGTLLHEATHYFWGLGTFDWTYSKKEGKELPDEGFLKTKQTNANNWEYFYESLVE